MSVPAAFFSRLSTDAGVSALVGNRIYPGLSPEGDFPLVSYTIKADTDEALNKSATQRYHVALACVALSYAASIALAAAVRTSLDRQVWTVGATLIQSCVFEDSDDSDYSEDGNPEQIYYESELTFNVLTTELTS